jgi:hypothetical protein
LFKTQIDEKVARPELAALLKNETGLDQRPPNLSIRWISRRGDCAPTINTPPRLALLKVWNPARSAADVALASMIGASGRLISRTVSSVLDTGSS